MELNEMALPALPGDVLRHLAHFLPLSSRLHLWATCGRARTALQPLLQDTRWTLQSIYGWFKPWQCAALALFHDDEFLYRRFTRHLDDFDRYHLRPYLAYHGLEDPAVVRALDERHLFEFLRIVMCEAFITRRMDIFDRIYKTYCTNEGIQSRLRDYIACALQEAAARSGDRTLLERAHKLIAPDYIAPVWITEGAIAGGHLDLTREWLAKSPHFIPERADHLMNHLLYCLNLHRFKKCSVPLYGTYATFESYLALLSLFTEDQLKCSRDRLRKIDERSLMVLTPTQHRQFGLLRAALGC